MHLLYLDESGNPNDVQNKFFVLAGFSIFERQCHWMDAAMTRIAQRFDAPNPSSVEFHGAPMRNGKGEWSSRTPADRIQAVADIFALLSEKQLKVRLYVSVIEKSLLPIDEILPRSFENLASEFDNFLAHQITQYGQAQRGIVILDKSHYEQKIQGLSYLFKHVGHSTGKLRNFAEVPLFLDSKASRLIQLADLVAYWTYRRYAALDDRGFRILAPHIRAYGGSVPGLCELISDETREKVSKIPEPDYPFPAPTPVV